MYGNLKGYAIIQYRNPDDARAAIKKMNGFAIGGRQLKVKSTHEAITYSGTLHDRSAMYSQEWSNWLEIHKISTLTKNLVSAFCFHKRD